MSDPALLELDRLLRRAREGRKVFVIGLTGGVAAGKSTLAAALAQAAAGWPDAGQVETVSTDGFLKPNSVLDAAGLTLEKGYPLSYDAAAMAQALHAVRLGAAHFPGYSHLTYDVDERLSRWIDRPDVLIVEGLGFSAETPVDLLAYIDASEADLEAWYVARFLAFAAGGREDPASFYHRFAALDAAGVEALARAVWATINLPNIRSNVGPLRGAADILIVKRADHAIDRVEFRGGAASGDHAWRRG